MENKIIWSAARCPICDTPVNAGQIHDDMVKEAFMAGFLWEDEETTGFEAYREWKESS